MFTEYHMDLCIPACELFNIEEKKMISTAAI